MIVVSTSSSRAFRLTSLLVGTRIQYDWYRRRIQPRQPQLVQYTWFKFSYLPFYLFQRQRDPRCDLDGYYVECFFLIKCIPCRRTSQEAHYALATARWWLMPHWSMDSTCYFSTLSTNPVFYTLYPMVLVGRSHLFIFPGNSCSVYVASIRRGKWKDSLIIQSIFSDHQMAQSRHHDSWLDSSAFSPGNIWPSIFFMKGRFSGRVPARR
jgi:hypothetical protein